MSQTKAQLIDPVDGTIVNADINASAAIAGTKIAPDFGSQNIVTTGGLTIDTNTLHVDSSNNRVGIGTTSPSVSLDIEATTPTIRLTDSDASGTPECEIKGGGGDLILSADRDGEKASTLMQFQTDGSTAMTIDSSQRVGIGTTSPDSNFHINLSSSSDGPILRFSNPNGGDGTYIGRIQCGDTTGSFFTGINFFKHDTDDGEIRFRMKVAGSNTDVLTLVDGRVGIGQTSPNTRFTIVQSANDNTGGLAIFDSAASSSFRIFRTGAGAGSVVSLQDRGTDVINIKDQTVGISTTSPRSRLDLGIGTDDSTVSNTAADYQLGLHAAQSAGGDIGRNIAFISQTQGTVCAAINTVDVGASDQTGLVFITGNSSSIAERVRIDQNGHVGINSAGTDTTYMTHIKSTSFGLLKLETTLTGADAPYLEMKHTSTSPADNDQLGVIQFKGKNSNDDDLTYGYLMFRSIDVTDGTEDGELQVVTHNAGVAAARLTVGQDGAIKANTGNFVVGTSGRGVQFDTADSGSDQLLDDYEEGSYTPLLTGDSGSVTSYHNSEGVYTKIGRYVKVIMRVRVNDSGNLGGNVKVSLPFTVKNVLSSTGLDGSGQADYWSSQATNIVHLSAVPASDTTTAFLYIATGATAVLANLTSSNAFGDGWDVRMHAEFFAD
jgi:hypothetical protein